MSTSLASKIAVNTQWVPIFNMDEQKEFVDTIFEGTAFTTNAFVSLCQKYCINPNGNHHVAVIQCMNLFKQPEDGEELNLNVEPNVGDVAVRNDRITLTSITTQACVSKAHEAEEAWASYKRACHLLQNAHEYPSVAACLVTVRQKFGSAVSTGNISYVAKKTLHLHYTAVNGILLNRLINQSRRENTSDKKNATTRKTDKPFKSLDELKKWFREDVLLVNSFTSWVTPSARAIISDFCETVSSLDRITEDLNEAEAARLNNLKKTSGALGDNNKEESSEGDPDIITVRSDIHEKSTNDEVNQNLNVALGNTTAKTVKFQTVTKESPNLLDAPNMFEHDTQVGIIQAESQVLVQDSQVMDLNLDNINADGGEQSGNNDVKDAHSEIDLNAGVTTKAVSKESISTKDTDTSADVQPEADAKDLNLNLNTNNVSSKNDLRVSNNNKKGRKSLPDPLLFGNNIGNNTPSLDNSISLKPTHEEYLNLGLKFNVIDSKLTGSSKLQAEISQIYYNIVTPMLVDSVEEEKEKLGIILCAAAFRYFKEGTLVFVEEPTVVAVRKDKNGNKGDGVKRIKATPTPSRKNRLLDSVGRDGDDDNDLEGAPDGENSKKSSSGLAEGPEVVSCSANDLIAGIFNFCCGFEQKKFLKLTAENHASALQLCKMIIEEKKNCIEISENYVVEINTTAAALVLQHLTQISRQVGLPICLIPITVSATDRRIYPVYTSEHILEALDELVEGNVQVMCGKMMQYQSLDLFSNYVKYKSGIKTGSGRAMASTLSAINDIVNFKTSLKRRTSQNESDINFLINECKFVLLQSAEKSMTDEFAPLVDKVMACTTMVDYQRELAILMRQKFEQHFKAFNLVETINRVNEHGQAIRTNV